MYLGVAVDTTNYSNAQKRAAAGNLGRTSTSGGTLSSGTNSGIKVIATTNSSGIATVTLTLAATKGQVTITAPDQFALGGNSVTFSATAD